MSHAVSLIRSARRSDVAEYAYAATAPAAARQIAAVLDGKCPRAKSLRHDVEKSRPAPLTR